MPPKINPNEIQWDAPAAIDPGKVQWDTAPAQQPMTEGEEMLSSIPSRFLSSMTAPAKVLLKMVGPDSIKKQLADVEAMRQRGIEKRNRDGFDWGGAAADFAGSLGPSALISKGVAAAVPAATAIGKIGQGFLTGAATGAAQPLPGGQDELSMEKVKQALLSGGLGAGVSALGQGVKAFFGSNKLSPETLQTYREGTAKGYTVPPSMVNPSGLNNTLESIAGKAAVKQDAGIRNQIVTNQLGAQDVGLAKNTSLSEAVLEKVRKDAGKVYEELANLRPTKGMEWFSRYHDKDLVHQLKKANLDANDAWKSFWQTKNPDMREKAIGFQNLADSIHNDLVKLAEANGKADLIPKLQAAKVRIAKAHDLENALVIGRGDVSAPTIGGSINKVGVRAKSGDALTIGKMASAFPQVMREEGHIPMPGVSGTDAAASAILGTLGYGAAGPSGVVAAAMPLLRPIARNIALSGPYQKHLAEGIPARYLPLLDAMAQQAAGAAGTTAGRNY